MQYFDLIFIVLCYRNSEDLRCFIKSLDTLTCSSKVVVVNSYYDKASYQAIKDIALASGCDFLSVENKGYGYGNNRGLEYAASSYEYSFLVVSNPDIEIRALDIKLIANYKHCIIAPSIITLDGKQQNPYYYTSLDIVERLYYIAYRTKYSSLAILGNIISRTCREFYALLYKNKVRKIYACHGSFIILGCKAMDRLKSVFNEDMFLFAEENHLARLAQKKHVEIYMIPTLQVFHKEDGSVGLEIEKMPAYAKQSFITYYQHWYK